MATIEITSCYQCPTYNLELVLESKDRRNDNCYGFCTHRSVNSANNLHSRMMIGRGNTADDFPVPDWCPHIKKG